jgi:cysteine desulfurase
VTVRHYLDHASTSPLRPEAREVLAAWLDGAWFGDPSRVHQSGLDARHLVEHAREQVAALLGCRGRSVVFTSGATEAIAAACWGAAERGDHQVVSAVEHSAVRASAEQHGPVTVVGVDGSGRVDPDAVLAAIGPGTAAVHVQWANHEVGTRQPVAEVVDGCRERGVLVHVDAAVGVGHDPIGFDELGADLLSVSGHKLGGPPGSGALLVRRGVRLRPLLVGGDQERARRAGMEAVPDVAALGAVCGWLAEPGRLEQETSHQRVLTDRVLGGIGDADGLRAYGDPVDRVPHIACLGFDDVEPQAVLLGLDRAGIAVHSGSACASEALEPSPVLAAMGVDAHRSLRVSVGWNSTDADVDALLDALPRVLRDLRALRR